MMQYEYFSRIRNSPLQQLLTTAQFQVRSAQYSEAKECLWTSVAHPEMVLPAFERDKINELLRVFLIIAPRDCKHSGPGLWPEVPR